MRKQVSAAVALVALALPLVAVPAAAGPEVAGEWLAPFSEDFDGDGFGDYAGAPPASRAESAELPTAVNAVVLAGGRILYWSQLDGTEAVDRSISFQLPQGASRSRVLDLGTGTQAPPASAWTTPSPEDAAGGDLVGSEQRHLPDGRVLAIGGTRWSNEDAAWNAPDGMGRTELYGLPDARIFDPATGTWTRVADMNRGRYYPAMLTLAEGSMFVAGGVERLIYNSSLAPGSAPPAHAIPQNIREVETYDPAADVWTLDPRPQARASLPPLARLHLLPDGTVFHPAVGMLFPPGGGDSDAAAWNDMRVFDPVTGTWHVAGAAPFGVRSNAFSVMLPLEAPYDSARFLVAGGTVGPWPGSYVATTLSELITWNAASPLAPSRTATGSLTTPRWHSTAVALPTGEVIALNGADRDEVIDPGSGIPVRRAEMFDPVTGRWSALADGARDRTLHNTAVLLRDGSILVGGHSPAPMHWGTHQQNAPGLSNNFKDPSFEIFRPPSLFRGSRPVITNVSGSVVARGGALTITTPDAADPTLRVVLSRLPSVTHITDADQRSVVVQHSVSAGSVTVTIPAGGGVVPSGGYYVFLVKDNGQGPTPSVAEIVRITA